MALRFLAGDIGGTNARLALYEVDPKTGKEVALGAKTYATNQNASLDACVEDFLKQFNANHAPPESCCIAVAGPVKEVPGTNDLVANMTNLQWNMSKNDLKIRFGFGDVALINDFAAVGYGLTALTPNDYLVLNEGKKRGTAPIACLGAGTGLGEVYLTHNGKEYDVWATEGGHSDYPAKNDLEFGLVKHVVEVEKKGRVSVERVVCGTAIPIIYRYLKTRNVPENPDIANQLAEPNADQAKIISENAFKENADKLCYESMMMFLRNYWAEAGNLALKTLPHGGLFIAGGIAPKIKNQILKHKEELMGILFDKGRMTDLLKTIPIYLVTHKSIGELGSEVVAKRLLARQGLFGNSSPGKPSSSAEVDSKFYLGVATGVAISSVVSLAVFAASRIKPRL